MKKKKLLLLCLLVMGLAIVLVSCGTAKLTRESNLETQNELQGELELETNPVTTEAIEATWWQPIADNDLHWHYQIGREINGSIYTNDWSAVLETLDDLTLLSQPEAANVKVIAIDLFDNSVEHIQTLKDMGLSVMCYVNVGATEDWRLDYHLFSAYLNALKDWPGENYLDTRSTSSQITDIKNVMTLRFLLAKKKGCDAIEPDNVDYWLFNQEGQFYTEADVENSGIISQYNTQSNQTLYKDLRQKIAASEDWIIRAQFARDYLTWISETAHGGLQTDSEATQFKMWLQNIQYVDPFGAGSTRENTLNELLTEIKQDLQTKTTIDIGLSVGLKNVTGLLSRQATMYNIAELPDDVKDKVQLYLNSESQINNLVGQFDWAMNEACAQYNECSVYEESFLNLSEPKAVFWVEYSGTLDNYCSIANTTGMSHMLSPTLKIDKVTKASWTLVADVARAMRCDVTSTPIDTTAPILSPSFNPSKPESGWYGKDVAEVGVTFNCTDADSGIKIDTVISEKITTQGINEITSSGDCIDHADNIAEALTVEVKIDRELPEITVDGLTADTTTCRVEDALSGVNESKTSRTVIDGPAENEQTVSCVGEDNAENSREVTKVFVMLPPPVEKPVITATISGVLGNNNWYTEASVSFSCTGSGQLEDTLSGQSIPLTDGESQTASSDVLDAVCKNEAGDAVTVTSEAVNVDGTAPVVAVKGLDESSYPSNNLPAPTCEVTDDTSEPVNPNPLPTISSANNGVVTVSCAGTDNAGNEAQPVTKTYTIVEAPPSETELYSTDFDNLNGWEKCWSRANLPTVSGSIAHFAGRKNSQGGTDCVKERVDINSQNVASSYTLTCEAKRSLGGRVELEVYLSGLRSQGTLQRIEPTQNSTFETYTLNLSNPDQSTKNIWIRIKAQRRNVGNNVVREADMFVDSCTLVANN